MNSNLGITGRIHVKIYDENGSIKYQSENHNIITAKGDAYICDLLSLAPTRTKISTGNCFIPVGTGWTGTNTKQNTWVNTQVGTSQAIDATFPKVKASYGSAGDNTLQFQVTYPPGSLNAMGINEAAITSHATNGVSNTTLAYAQLSPSANVSLSDTLVILWEINFIGS